MVEVHWLGALGMCTTELCVCLGMCTNAMCTCLKCVRVCAWFFELFGTMVRRP